MNKRVDLNTKDVVIITGIIIVLICLVGGFYHDKILNHEDKSKSDNGDKVIDNPYKDIPISSANGYIDAVQTYITLEALNGKNDYYNYEGFNKTDVEVRGQKPSQVDLDIVGGIVANGSMVFDQYRIYIEKGSINTEKIEKNKYISFNDDCTKNCEYIVNFMDKKTIVKYDVVGDSEKSQKYIITINGNKIQFNDMMCGGPTSLYALKDNFVITTHETCDIKGNHMYIYNKNLDKVYTLVEIDKEVPKMELDNNSINIVNDKIIFSANRISHGPSIVTKNDLVYVCDKEELKKYDFNENTIVSGTYELTYLGNDEYSSIIRADQKTLNESGYLNQCE